MPSGSQIQGAEAYEVRERRRQSVPGAFGLGMQASMAHGGGGGGSVGGMEDIFAQFGDVRSAMVAARSMPSSEAEAADRPAVVPESNLRSN